METKQVTVAGKLFAMPIIFKAGQELTLTEGMASQFNQVYHENIRNNFAKKVSDKIEKGEFDQDAFQTEIDKYADEYEFGTRRSGGPRAPADPVAREALRLAVDAISNKLRAEGKKPNDFSNLKEIAAKLVEKNPAFTEKAKENIAERERIASETIGDIMGQLTEKEADEQSEAA
jgi:hypothetical protein